MNSRTMADNQKFTYQNTANTEQSVINVGKVKPGATITVDEPLYNPNFKLVDGGRMVNVEAPTEQPKAGKTIKGSTK